MYRLAILLVAFGCASKEKEAEPDLLTKSKLSPVNQQTTSNGKGDEIEKPKAAVHAASGFAGDSSFQPIVGVLTKHPEWRNIDLQALEPHECARIETEGWVTAWSGGEHPAICLSDGVSEPRCVAYAGGDRLRPQQILCKKETVPPALPTPSWAKEILKAAQADPSAGIFIRPVGEDGVDALWLGSTAAMGHHLAITSHSEWSWIDLPLLSELELYNHVEVTDTSEATGVPSFGIVARGYDGGSGQGEEQTELRIVIPDGNRLAEVGKFPIGYLFWSWSTQERKASRKESATQALSHRDRPHVEIALRPNVKNGSLELTQTSPALSGGMKRRFACTDDESAGFDCPIPTIAAIAAITGTWKWNGNAFVREP